jgi:NAD/NADP transhydrogenase beta subunit
VAAVLFVLSLHGLSKHEKAKEGNAFGVTGMVIALAATIWLAADRAENALVTLLLIAVQVAIVRRLSTHLTISWDTIMGALCVYLLFSMIFAGLYSVVGHLENGRLFAQQNEFTSTDALYFSLTTLTTVGFGDLSMRADVTRIAAAMEGLLGQIYLITAVALLVGNLGQRRRAGPARSRKPSRRSGET